MISTESAIKLGKSKIVSFLILSKSSDSTDFFPTKEMFTLVPQGADFILDGGYMIRCWNCAWSLGARMFFWTNGEF